MTKLQTEVTVQRDVVLAVLEHLKRGEIEDATACFAETFQFRDRGIGVELADRERLVEFFQKSRELYPESSLHVDDILVSGNRVVMEWTLRTGTAPFWGGLTRSFPISVHGASVVRVEGGRIKGWSDYYDGLVSQRTALASQFTEWVEP
jgi:ketosteroid isomerase-like protein